MEKITSDLKEWFIIYIKHRDVFLKKIKEIKDIEKNHINIIQTDKTIKTYIYPKLDESIKEINNLNNNEDINIITANNSNNIKICIKDWNLFSKYNNLKIYFVNPYSKNNEKKWILSPYTHNKIAETKMLKQGLISMSENVEEVTNDSFK
jgi:hypothetical protein